MFTVPESDTPFSNTYSTPELVPGRLTSVNVTLLVKQTILLVAVPLTCPKLEVVIEVAELVILHWEGRVNPICVPHGFV